MIIDHQHFPPQLKGTKRTIIITRDKPFVVVISERFTFLNATLISILKEYGYAYMVKKSPQKKVMGYVLPILCCEDVVLQKQGLIQLLADIALSQYDFGEYMLRKQNFTKLYKSWFNLLDSQYEQNFTLPNIEQLTKNEHTNRAFEEFINLSIFVVNRGYQRIFRNYQPQRFNIESIFLTDVTETILNKFPRTCLDYILRAYFSGQIDFNIKYTQKLNERMKDDEPEDRNILMDGQEPKLQNCPLKNTNMKWFTGVLVGLGVIFARYAQ